MSDNTITICGNLTRDPELRFTTGGKATCTFSLAVNRRWMVGNEWQEQTSFFNVLCWEKLAENVAASALKGARLIVTGRLEQRTWEKDGEKRHVVELVADDVGFSLRWATGSMERVERTSAHEEPRRRGRSADPVYGDEEPF